MREQRLLLALVRDPLTFHRRIATPMERATLLNLRNRDLVDFFDLPARLPDTGKEWWMRGSEPGRCTVTTRGIASLKGRAAAMLLLGAGT